MTVLENSPTRRPLVASKSRLHRSRVGNGKDLLPDIDGRSAIARRFKEITSAVVIDQGGIERLSESRIQLIRRFSAACVLAERMESRLVNDEEIDIQEHSLLCSTLVRIAQRIGINRVPKNVTPHLHDYLEAHAEAAE
jgi:hypothetical protein